MQICDCDSGRLFKLQGEPRRQPAAGPDAGRPRAPDEEHLDAAHAVAAVNGLLGGADLTRWCGRRRLEESVVASLAGQTPWRTAECPPGQPQTAPQPARRIRDSRRCARACTRRQPPTGRAWCSPRRAHRCSGQEAPCLPGVRPVRPFRSDWLFLCVSAGFGRHDGGGGHPHVEQLGLEISIEGVDWIRDPGSHVYSASLHLENGYRSSVATSCRTCSKGNLPFGGAASSISLWTSRCAPRRLASRPSDRTPAGGRADRPDGDRRRAGDRRRNPHAVRTGRHAAACTLPAGSRGPLRVAGRSHGRGPCLLARVRPP